MADLAEIAVVGGSGFYEFLEDAEEVKLDTPFGAPSDPITVGEVAGRRVAFLPRHGRDHRFPPHKIPYRANMWALRSLGVRRVLAPTAVGSLTHSYGPGTLAFPDQLVDRTRTREQTYYDEGACHVPFADPYCPSVRTVAIATAREQGWVPASSGTLVVIEGPRFSSRAESQWFAAQGWTLVGMTGHPEAVLARELALCYAPLALVTDLDAGLEEGEGVTQAEVFEVFAANIKRLRNLVATIIATLPADREDDLCAHALDGITLPFPPVAPPLPPHQPLPPLRPGLSRPRARGSASRGSAPLAGRRLPIRRRRRAYEARGGRDTATGNRVTPKPRGGGTRMGRTLSERATTGAGVSQRCCRWVRSSGCSVGCVSATDTYHLISY